MIFIPFSLHHSHSLFLTILIPFSFSFLATITITVYQDNSHFILIPRTILISFSFLSRSGQYSFHFPCIILISFSFPSLCRVSFPLPRQLATILHYLPLSSIFLCGQFHCLFLGQLSLYSPWTILILFSPTILISFPCTILPFPSYEILIPFSFPSPYTILIQTSPWTILVQFSMGNYHSLPLDNSLFFSQGNSDHSQIATSPGLQVHMNS